MLVLSPELAFCSNRRTAGVPQLWSLLSMCARQQLRTCEGTLLKEDWKQSCTLKCSNSDAVLFPACRRLISLPSLAAHYRMDITDFPVRNLAQKNGRVGLCDKHFAYYLSRNAERNELKPWQHEHWCLPSVGGEAGRSHGRCAGSL